MRTIYLYLLSFLFLFMACEEKTADPISKSGGKPDKVTEITTEATPGGVIISYRIPNNEDVLGVKAVYTITNGRTYESSSSYYNSSLELEGYNDVREYEAKVYTINRAQELSDPVIVKFTPLESPIKQTEKTIKVFNSYGGIVFIWDNPANYPLDYEIFTATEKESFRPVAYTTSKALADTLTIIDLPGIPHRFATVIRDRWGNETDTIHVLGGNYITPFIQEKLSKGLMKALVLDNDTKFDEYEGEYQFVIDDLLTTYNHTPMMNVSGASFTVDLGRPVKLSSFRLFHRPRSSNDEHAGYYYQGNLRVFELFGCLETPSQSGNWSEWTKLLNCEVKKPSGLEGLAMTDDDMALAESGFPFTLPMTEEEQIVRYVRFRVNTVWGNINEFIYVAELDFYGQNAE